MKYNFQSREQLIHEITHLKKQRQRLLKTTTRRQFKWLTWTVFFALFVAVVPLSTLTKDQGVYLRGFWCQYLVVVAAFLVCYREMRHNMRQQAAEDVIVNELPDAQRDEREALHEKLELAIAEEDYHAAAQIRDALSKYENG